MLDIDEPIELKHECGGIWPLMAVKRNEDWDFKGERRVKFVS